MKNINKNKMQVVILAALAAAVGDSRWTNAITRAAEEIETNPSMIWYGGALLIVSPSSGETYRANGTCQCKAFIHGSKPCWHRAASRLVKSYHEAA